jgi:hypothetical protein
VMECCEIDPWLFPLQVSSGFRIAVCALTYCARFFRGPVRRDGMTESLYILPLRSMRNREYHSYL